MTSIKIKFRSSIIKGEKGTLYYQIIHKRVIRQIYTKYKVLNCEWHNQAETLIVNRKDRKRVSYLSLVQKHIEQDKSIFQRIVLELKSGGMEFTSDDIVNQFREQKDKGSFFSFMRMIIVQLMQSGKKRTVETYSSALNSFLIFCGDKDLAIEEITSNLMIQYEAYLKRKGLTLNTVSFYMRILRAVYNRAVENELVEQCFPFKRVFTGMEQTVKRAVPFHVIKKIKSLELSEDSSLNFARNMFLFSFYTRGMSFVDMAFLKKHDLKDIMLSYRRRKTGQHLYIKWERCMQRIVETHPSHLNSPYLLPIIKPGTSDEWIQYKNKLAQINRNLKTLGKSLGLITPLTMYVARHSWASIAYSKQIPISVISQGMGHNSETTTRIYLASLDNSIVDEANKRVLRGL